MVRLSAPSPLALVFATASAVLAAGCFDTSSTITTADYPTRLTVDPVMFRGALQCGAPGLEHYVVALYDVTFGEDPDLRVTSSGPVTCLNVVTFGDTVVKSTHFYKATIDGYDRKVMADANGDDKDAARPKMVDVSSGEEVSPRWATTCGEVPPNTPAADADIDVLEDAPPPYNQLRYPTQVLGRTEVILHGCRPLAATTLVDASTDDGSTGGGDGSADAGAPLDASAEASDVADPDGGGPGDDAGPDAGTTDGDEEGGTHEAGDDGGTDAGDEEGGVDAEAADVVGRALSPLSRLGVANRSLHA